MASDPISLTPATLKEASVDSPTFRGTVLHYAEQTDVIEKWLEGFIKASTKLVNDVCALEDPIHNFLVRAVPTNISESLLDHDYTLLAMQKYVEGSRGFWMNIIAGAKKVQTSVVDPLVVFQRADLKNFRETRRTLEATQQKYDSLLARYLGQNKTKEPSALREDAFQLYEARKAYIKACFDFCEAAPVFRTSFDRVLTKVLTNQWREQMELRKDTTGIQERCGADLMRVRAWCDSMEANESIFLKQLIVARKELEKRARIEYQPARELDEYSVSTVPFLGTRPSVAAAAEGEDIVSEKQGWLNMRTMSGKPARSVWVRRWFFVKNGIFGWLVQGYRGGGVEESEKVGVLLCNIKPAYQEERRFCFEVKTKDTTILLQTETQADLTSWMAVFEQAKRSAVESATLVSSTQAFAILPPSAPAPPSEPAYVTKGHDGNTVNSEPRLLIPRHNRHDGRDSSDGLTFQRSATLGVNMGGANMGGANMGGGEFSRAASMDVSRPFEPTVTHRKASSQAGDRAISRPGSSSGGGSGGGGGGGTGITALIAASQNALPNQAAQGYNSTTLAPNTLAGTPSPVNLLTASMVTGGNGGAGRGTPPEHQKGHRKTVSLDVGRDQADSDLGAYFPGYPLELKVQDEHFRCLFPSARDDVVLLVFRAVWSPNDKQELPGRCFVTANTLYFYAHHLGLLFTSITPFTRVSEVKAAPEKDCDYLFLHLKPEEGAEPSGKPVTVTIKTFLEPLRLLQRRISLIVKNANHSIEEEGDGERQLPSRELLRKLVAMEKEVEEMGSDADSWEDVGLYIDGSRDDLGRRAPGEIKLRIDDINAPRAIDERARDAARLKLPSAPVVYQPPGMTKKPLSREFEISPKALFHVLFGEKSTVFQTVYAQRRAQPVSRGPWKELDKGKARRQFKYTVSFGRSQRADIVDHQTIEKQEDHLCYVVTDVKTPWHLPHHLDFILVSKIVITHVAKSRSRLEVWTRVDWFKEPRFTKSIVQSRAEADLTDDALDLGDVVAENVHRHKSLTTAQAIAIFGTILGSAPPVDAPKASPVPMQPTSRTQTIRIPIKHRTLFQLHMETTLSFLESCITTIVMSIFGLIKAGWGIITAHRILVLMLAASIALNSTLTIRSTVSYWTERRANSFLQAVDVAPGGIMARSLRLSDLEDAIALNDSVPGGTGACYNQFQLEGGDTGTRMGRQLGSGRERLGMYRHDLIVALRVVNSLEKDLVSAEWRRWIRSEVERCRVAEEYLEEAGGEADWLRAYCGSCEEAGRSNEGLTLG